MRPITVLHRAKSLVTPALRRMVPLRTRIKPPQDLLGQLLDFAKDHRALLALVTTAGIVTMSVLSVVPTSASPKEWSTTTTSTPTPTTAPPTLWHPVRVASPQDYTSNGQVRSLAGMGIRTQYDKRIALTFDDGPAPNTPEVLQILQEKQVPATFCMVGTHVRERPDLARSVAEAGMGLCNHTEHHNLSMVRDTPQAIESEIRLASEAILAATGKMPTFFRAPGGRVSPVLLEKANSAGLPVIYWTVDPQDWTKPGTDRIIADVLNNARPDSIVLLHDGGADMDSRRQTVDALPIIIDNLRAQGYTFVDVADLL